MNVPDPLVQPTMKVPDPLIQPTMTVNQVAPIYGLGRWAAYQAVKAGQIPSITIGRRILIPTAAVRRQLGIDVEENEAR